MQYFYKLDKVTGSITPMTVDDWHGVIRAPQMSANVPAGVRQIFNEACDVMLHGTCSLPLFTRGMEHALRAAEAAVSARAEMAGVPMRNADGFPIGFAVKLRRLKKLKVLTRSDVRTWTGLRKLRNSTAHPTQAFRLPPGATISILQAVASSIERLF
jgi:hypothetical protein